MDLLLILNMHFTAMLVVVFFCYVKRRSKLWNFFNKLPETISQSFYESLRCVAGKYLLQSYQNLINLEIQNLPIIISTALNDKFIDTLWLFNIERPIFRACFFDEKCLVGFLTFVMRYAIWNHLYNLKNGRNTHTFTKSNTPPWMFSSF